MSSPILKALYFCTRLFFCEIMRFLLGILFFILLQGKSNGQSTMRSLESMDYINVNYLFSTTEMKTVNSGFRLNNLGHNNSFIDSINLSPSIDSNAYSTAIFNIGSIATQNIGLNIIRPLSKEGRLYIEILRESNPGWVARSFYRNTDINIGYTQRIKDKISLRTAAGIEVMDREQSGGAMDSLNYNLSNSGVTELNIEGNVWLTDAYNRSNRVYLEGDVDYDWVQRRRFLLKPGIGVSGSSEKFRYVDNAPDSAYYGSFIAFEKNSIQDSIALRELKINPYLSFDLGHLDSNWLNVELGLNQRWYKLVNNDHGSIPMNQSVFGNVNFNKGQISGYGKYEYYTAGYNVNDIDLNSAIEYKMVSNDSNLNYVSIEASQIYVFRRVARIFEDYRSVLKSNKNTLSKEGQEQYGIGINAFLGSLRSNLDLQYSKIENYTYFDEYARVNQKAVPIEIYSVQIEIAYSGSFFELSSLGKYQWTGRSKYYSLPEWTNINQGSLSWNMFKKRLRMNGGLQSRFFSEYFNRGYLPFYDAQYVQSFHRFEDYFQLDGFLKTSIKSVSVGVVANNVLYGVIDSNPIIAPNMPSIPRYFSLRFEWNFKN